ncbi:hypothetical protein NFI96_006370 [Prochilodus magdalenae]|nr:hypothetical protein NFI96_006370 [Prochilodus magdalenae]
MAFGEQTASLAGPSWHLPPTCSNQPLNWTSENGITAPAETQRSAGQLSPPEDKHTTVLLLVWRFNQQQPSAPSTANRFPSLSEGVSNKVASGVTRSPRPSLHAVGLRYSPSSRQTGTDRRRPGLSPVAALTEFVEMDGAARAARSQCRDRTYVFLWTYRQFQLEQTEWDAVNRLLQHHGFRPVRFADPTENKNLAVPADGAVGVEVEGHQAFWTCDDTPSILVLTTVPPHTDSLGVSTKTKAGLVTEDDPLPF